MWARRMLMGSGLTVASLALASGVAGAAGCGSMSAVNCSVTPVIAATSSTPTVASTAGSTGTGTEPATVAATSTSTGSSSLPFTGADIEELAVVGVGAVLAGGLLLRRRRRTVEVERD
jgi:LPXTG-motif cell wall-anchored protein